MMKETELKPCPFCGHKAKVKVCDGSGTYYTDIGTEMYYGRKMTHCLIICERCRARTQAYLTRRGVFNAWNRRADIEEVRHGYWIDKPTGRYCHIGSYCSVCEEKSGIGGIESNRHKPYCPNCGAKMDGTSKERS